MTSVELCTTIAGVSKYGYPVEALKRILNWKQMFGFESLNLTQLYPSGFAATQDSSETPPQALQSSGKDHGNPKITHYL